MGALLLAFGLWMLPAAAKWLGRLLLFPFYAPAWLLLYICRDIMLYASPEPPPDEDRMAAIFFWTTGLPFLAVVMWLVYGMLVLDGVVDSLPHVAFLVSTAIWLVCYYYIYYERYPEHPNWPSYLATQEAMMLEIKTEALVERLRLQLQVLDFLYR